MDLVTFKFFLKKGLSLIAMLRHKAGLWLIINTLRTEKLENQVYWCTQESKINDSEAISRKKKIFGHLNIFKSLSKVPHIQPEPTGLSNCGETGHSFYKTEVIISILKKHIN